MSRAALMLDPEVVHRAQLERNKKLEETLPQARVAMSSLVSALDLERYDSGIMLNPSTKTDAERDRFWNIWILESVDRMNDHMAMLSSATTLERKAQHIAALLLIRAKIADVRRSRGLTKTPILDKIPAFAEEAQSQDLKFTLGLVSKCLESHKSQLADPDELQQVNEVITLVDAQIVALDRLMIRMAMQVNRAPAAEHVTRRTKRFYRKVLRCYMAEKAVEEGALALADCSVGLSLAAVGMGQVPLAPGHASWGGAWIDQEEVLQQVLTEHEDDVDSAWPEVPANEITPSQLLEHLPDKCVTDRGWFPNYLLITITTSTYDIANKEPRLPDPNSPDHLLEVIMNER